MKKVVYVDDEADTEKMDSKFDILKDEGIDIEAISSVGDVLPTLKRLDGSFNLIVLDLSMPPEDFYTLEETNGGSRTGFRLLEDIRKEYKDIPIIIVSIIRQTAINEELKKHKIEEYVQKPVLASELANVIKRILSKF
jgi:CheY-like chemotaxis protein